jgi:hypothetical protein
VARELPELRTYDAENSVEPRRMLQSETVVQRGLPALAESYLFPPKEVLFCVP